MWIKRLYSSGSFDHRDLKLWATLILHCPGLLLSSSTDVKKKKNASKETKLSRLCSAMVSSRIPQPMGSLVAGQAELFEGTSTPPTAGYTFQRATPPATATAARPQLAVPRSGGLGGTVIPKPDILVLLHAKVFRWYTLANFLIALCCSLPDTDSSLRQGCQPQESHSKPPTNPFLLISPVHTVCFSLLLSKSVILQTCRLLSREAKESRVRRSLFVPEPEEQGS